MCDGRVGEKIWMERFGVRFGVYKNGIFNEQLFPFDAIPRVMFGRDLSPEKLAELKQLIIDEPRRWIAQEVIDFKDLEIQEGDERVERKLSNTGSLRIIKALCGNRGRYF